MKKVMISVAPVSAGDPFINPRAIARDVFECYKNGAAMVHLHVRDLNGRLTPSLGLLEETARYIRELCDIIIEISTGGVSSLTIEERVQPCYAPWVEATSLNVGSVNLGEAVYANPIKDVRYCVSQIVENGKIPETELFELGMSNTLRELDEQFCFKKPMLLALVFGHPGEMPATEAALKHMIDGVYDNFAKEDVKWGYTEAHRKDFTMVKKALTLGADALRIGFEDSDYLDENTRVETNAELIKEAARLVREAGMEPMTPAEAREMLSIPSEIYHFEEAEETPGTVLVTVSDRGGSLQDQVADVRNANKQRVIYEVVRRCQGEKDTAFICSEYVILPNVPGKERLGVHTLNSLEDRVFLKEFVRTPFVKDIIVYGGGSEEGERLVDELKAAGRNVKVIDPDSERILSFSGRTFIEELKTDKGTYVCDLFIMTK
ncbi:MAG: 3-keto-5-aminohexanoate cleavage protein [Lachnospiraceae bacterium]|nr:3-keto-5-aminohexanoate cleavage protein [Lachnospiraceae bacterium]